MALSRKLQKIFASTATILPTRIFGTSISGGTTTTDIAQIQSNAAWEKGFEEGSKNTLNNIVAPTVNDMNSIFKVTTEQLEYIFQQGGVTFPYLATQNYNINAYVHNSTDGKIYRSKTVDNIGNALTNTTHWEDTTRNIASYLPQLAAVATSGSYNDLINTPTIPPAQVNSDWNATSGVAQILNKPTTGFKNYIINGNFDFWQRGQTQSYPGGGGGYLSDRWLASSTTANYSQARRSLSPNESEQIEGNPQYTMRIDKTSTTVLENTELLQKVEDVRTLANTTVTLSAYLRTDTPMQLNFGIRQNFGAGGSAPIVLLGTLFNVTSTWAKYSQTFNIPSIAGKTIGTNSFLDIIIVATSTSPFVFECNAVQLEKGNIASPFENRPLALELCLCQRYYEKSYDIEIAPGTISQNSAVQGVALNATDFTDLAHTRFRVSKRIVPTISLYNPGTGAINTFWNVSAGVTQGTAVIRSPSLGQHGMSLFSPSGGFVPPNIYSIHYTAEAEL